MYAVYCGNTERLNCREINCHGAENGPIDMRSVAKQFHNWELTHHLQIGIASSGQPSVRCDFRGALSNLVIYTTLSALAWCPLLISDTSYRLR